MLALRQKCTNKGFETFQVHYLLRRGYQRGLDMKKTKNKSGLGALRILPLHKGSNTFCAIIKFIDKQVETVAAEDCDFA